MKAILRTLSCCLCFACLLGGSQVQAKSFTLALVGDLMLGRGVAAAHQQDGWSDVFSAISNELQSADLALGNLESPLGTNDNTPSAGNSYNLCTDPSAAEILAEAGFDALSTANNHRSDCGNGTSITTEDALTSTGILYINENNNPLELTINGIKLALLAYDDISAAIDLEDALATIREASIRNDLVIVSMHWGMEYQNGATPRQKELAYRMSLAGADLIWGHHPHVLQPVEWIEGKTGKATTFVAYSLGNALFDQTMLAETQRSAMLILTMNHEGVIDVNIIPFIIQPATFDLHPADRPDQSIIEQRLYYFYSLDPIAADNIMRR